MHKVRSTNYTSNEVEFWWWPSFQPKEVKRCPWNASSKVESIYFTHGRNEVVEDVAGRGGICGLPEYKSQIFAPFRNKAQIFAPLKHKSQIFDSYICSHSDVYVSVFIWSLLTRINTADLSAVVIGKSWLMCHCGPILINATKPVKNLSLDKEVEGLSDSLCI